jgi:NADH-quinone oxidoreductase subunit L
MVTAFLTAFYMFRLVFLTFFGESRTPESLKAHIHESPSTMTLPLVILAILSIFGGLLNLPEFFVWPGALSHFLRPVLVEFPGFGHNLHLRAHLEVPLMGVSAGIALVGIFFSYIFYLRAPGLPVLFGYYLRPVYNLLWNKYYVDEVYDTLFVRPLIKTSQASARADLVVIDGAVNGSAYLTKETSRVAGLFDLWFIDGIVNLLAQGTLRVGSWARSLQTGIIQNYLAYTVAGALLVFALLWAFIENPI